MDPEVTLQEMIEAFDAEDFEEAGEKAANLLTWINRGGFVPAFPEGYDQSMVIRLLCETVAQCGYLRLQLSLEQDELTGGSQ